MDWLHKKAFWMSLASIVDIILKGVPPLNLESSIKDGIKYIKAFGGTKLSYDIPVEYTQVDYAIKKGTAGVQGKFDTGIKPTVDDVKIEMKVKIGDEAQQSGQTTVGSFYACQARATASSEITGISGSSANGSINGMQNGQSVASGIIRIKDHIDIIRYEYKNGNHSIYVKDLTTNTEDTQTGTYTFGEPTKNLYIFGNTTTTNNLNNNNVLYYCKIWVSGSLVFDAVPVIRNSDDVVGLYDKVTKTFIEPIISSGGGFVAGDVTTPTPSDPMDIYCNNGVLKILDKSDWTIFTNPTSIAGQGVFISADGKWYNANDRGAGCAIPLTIGKQYTLVIHKKTAELGTILRYGQSPQETPTGAGIQLTDWYRGDITDGQMISFVAKQPYLVMQLSADAVEAGMIQEAIEVLEAQGGDYTFLKYIETTGTQYIETGLSGAARWVGAGQGTSNSNGSKCILSALTSSANVYIASRFGSANAGRYWTIYGNVQYTQTPTLNYAEYDIDFQADLFEGTINGETVSRSNNLTFTTWTIGTAFGTGTTQYPFIGYIYRQQAYQNNVLVGDFIPAIRNSDNVVGMYDTVSGTFYTNAGTGVFIAGTPLGDGEVLKLTPSNDTAGVANLLKIDNYKDEQEIITGAITHNCKVAILTGQETGWMRHSTYYWFYNSETGYDWPASRVPVICSILPNLPLNSSQGQAGQFVSVGHNSGTSSRIIVANNFSAETTVADFKQWLADLYEAGTPLIVVYPATTPYTEVSPVPQTMQTTAGDNVLDIVQAGMSGLEVETCYTKG